MSSQKEFNEISSQKIEMIRSKLNAIQPKLKSKTDIVTEAVAKLLAEIQRLQHLGYSQSEIAQILSPDLGVSAATVIAAMRRVCDKPIPAPPHTAASKDGDISPDSA